MALKGKRSLYSQFAEEEEFYAVLGRAITKWADLEQELFRIVHRILRCPEERAAIVFYRCSTIGARLALANDLVASCFPQKEPGRHTHRGLERWGELYKKIDGGLKVRNSLAHHPAGLEVDVYVAADGNLFVESVAASRISRTKQLYKGQQPALTKKEIETHTELVRGLTTSLTVFLDSHLRRLPTRARIPHEPQTNPDQETRRGKAGRRQPQSSPG